MSSVMKSCAVPLRATGVWIIHTIHPRLLLTGRLGHQMDCLGITVLVFQSPLFYLIMSPKLFTYLLLPYIVKIGLFYY